jgi:2-methylisocitrate lyase-like PEP mutase family enzyme
VNGPARLDELLRSGSTVVAPGIFDGFSARATQISGFEAAYVTGAGSSLSNFGLPDLGLVGQSEMVEHISRLREATELPLIVDADTGFGGAVNVFRTVQRYERAGAAAIQLEDQTFPKRCGHLPGKELIDADVFCARIALAIEARDDERMRIIARTDALAVDGFEAALKRSEMYVDAGADMIFVESPETLEQMEEICTRIQAPIMMNMISSSVTPTVTLTELQRLGVAIAIYPMINMASAMHAMLISLKALREDGDDRSMADLYSPQELFELFDLDDWTSIGVRCP